MFVWSKMIVFISLFMLFSTVSCQKAKDNPPVKQENKPAEVEKKAAVNTAEKKEPVKCSVFYPPWGDEFWESWGKAHPEEFEKWYGVTVPVMSRVTVDDIKRCGDMENVFIGFTKIDSLDVFANMTKLKKLDMRFASNIKDLSPLKGLNNLEYLNIWKTAVTDLSPIISLPNLKTIDAKMTSISDVSSLNDMQILESIDLLQTKVSDIKAFANLTNIKEVLLCSTDVKDLTPVYSRAEQVTYLDLCNTGFTDFNILRKFKNLQRLKLWGVKISDLSVLSDMKELYELDLWNTSVTTLKPLYKLKNLKRLVIAGLTIDPAEVDVIKKNNPDVKIVTEAE